MEALSISIPRLEGNFVARAVGLSIVIPTPLLTDLSKVGAAGHIAVNVKAAIPASRRLAMLDCPILT